MYLIDTNILIYSGEARYASLLLPYVTDTANGVSLISHIETLGFHRITPAQITYFSSLFKILRVLPINDAIAKEAIQIRQNRKVALGDAIIAATALVYDIEIVTRNTADFAAIPHVKVINPIP